MKKIFISFLASIVLILSFALSACTNKEVAVGKYYADGNKESYIEILEDKMALFVNVDLSEVQEGHDSLGEDINVIELTSVPIPYVLGTGDHIMFEYHEWFALWAVYDFENKAITFSGNLYCYQA